MIIPPKFALFECANMDYLIRDIENERFLNRKEEVELLNDLSEANKLLCNILSGTYNKERESFDLIHKIRELEKENWRLKKILTLNAIDYNPPNMMIKMNIIIFILLDGYNDRRKKIL